MTTGRTTNLDLALPVEGELSGQWGDMVNNGITKYVDIAVAGTQTISGSQTAVTLNSTEGDDTTDNIAQVGAGATGSSQYMIINCTGNPASLLTITAPATSKMYVVINATSTSQSVKIVGTGPTTGVTLLAGEKAVVAWNGSDFVKASAFTGDMYGATSTASPFKTVYGFEAGNNNSGSGTNNTFVGYKAGRGNINGTDNVALGYNALILGSPTQAVAVGSSALADGASGKFACVGVGYRALQYATGSNNVAVGSSALGLNTTATDNVAVGYNALFTTVTGASNVAIGTSALSATTSTGNVALGYRAGAAVTLGQVNTIIGYDAAFSGSNNLTTGVNNIIIGNAASSSSATVSNEITLGNSSVTSFRIPGLSVTWGANTVPYRNIPPVGTKTSSYILTTADVGKYVQVGTGGSITIPDATFAEGDVVSIFNNTTGNVTITCSITTAYIAGTDSDKATMTLATRGVATILFISSTICVVSGSVT